MNPAERIELLRAALRNRPGRTAEDLHATIVSHGGEMRLQTVKSTLHAFREYFACDQVTGLWHLRFSRHSAA